MAEAYLVDIDLEALREDLSRAEKHPLSEDQVLSWLQEVGFRPANGGWIGFRNSMRLLKPSEIIMAEPFA